MFCPTLQRDIRKITGAIIPSRFCFVCLKFYVIYVSISALDFSRKTIKSIAISTTSKDILERSNKETEAVATSFQAQAMRSGYPPIPTDFETFAAYLQHLDDWCSGFVRPVCRYTEEPRDFKNRRLRDWETATQRPPRLDSQSYNQYEEEIILWVADRQVPTMYGDETPRQFEARFRVWARDHEPHRRRHETVDEFYDRVHEWRVNVFVLPQQFDEDEADYRRRLRDFLALIAPPLPTKREKPSRYATRLEEWRDTFVPTRRRPDETDKTYNTRVHEWERRSSPPDQGVKETDDDYSLRMIEWIEDYVHEDAARTADLAKKLSESSIEYKNRILEWSSRVELAPVRHASETESMYEARFGRWREIASRPKRKRDESNSDYDIRLTHWLSRTRQPSQRISEPGADFNLRLKDWLQARALLTNRGVAGADTSAALPYRDISGVDIETLKNLQLISRKNTPKSTTVVSKLSKLAEFKVGREVSSSDTDEEYTTKMEQAKAKRKQTDEHHEDNFSMVTSLIAGGSDDDGGELLSTMLSTFIIVLSFICSLFSFVFCLRFSSF